MEVEMGPCPNFILSGICHNARDLFLILNGT